MLVYHSVAIVVQWMLDIFWDRCHVFVFCCLLWDRNDGDVICIKCLEFRIPSLSTCPRTAQPAKLSMRIDVLCFAPNILNIYHILRGFFFKQPFGHLVLIILMPRKRRFFYHHPTAHEEPVAATAPPEEASF